MVLVSSWYSTIIMHWTILYRSRHDEWPTLTPWWNKLVSWAYSVFGLERSWVPVLKPPEFFCPRTWLPTGLRTVYMILEALLVLLWWVPRIDPGKFRWETDGLCPAVGDLAVSVNRFILLLTQTAGGKTTYHFKVWKLSSSRHFLSLTV